ncbi:MAG TPA: chondroitinase-B domain-containing protein, partial [Lacipirellula sp.]
QNTFLRCSGALTLRHGHRALVQGNYFVGKRAAGTGGVRVIGSGHRIINNYFSDTEGDDSRAALSLMNGLADSPPEGYEPVADVVVAFNSFVNCKESIVVGLAEDEEPDVAPADCVIANNLIVPRHDRKAIFIRTEPKAFRWAGNLVQGEIGATIRGIQEIDDLQLEEEGFVRRLTAMSGAIDAAAPGFDEVTRDIAGRERCEPKDVGCEEYARVSGRFKPIARENVGVRWQ